MVTRPVISCAVIPGEHEVDLKLAAKVSGNERSATLSP